ncbi:MAG TPA: NAD-dependent epimerase/dehydratase family protein [Nevskia sp.]|nr:NAD-dependent epimerase/dehydratase family protein [Nevskia sp.]
MRVAVTGGGGRLGCSLVRALLERGDRVRVLEPGKTMPASLTGLDVELLHGSVLVTEDVRRLVEGAEAVFHLAAKVDLGKDRDGSIRAVNVVGTRIVAEACAARGIRLVHCSSHHALVRHPLDQPLDERRPLALDEPCDYHRSKAHAELLIQDLVRGGGLDAVVVSPGTMIGPHDYEPSLMGKALLDLYHRRIPVLMEVVSDYVDVRDVAAGMIAAAQRGRRGERYLLTGAVHDLRTLCGMWQELTGVPVPRRVLPLWVGWAMLPFALVSSRITGKPPVFTPGVLRASVSNTVVSHAKAQAELDFAPRGTRESLADALAFYQAQGWLENKLAA